MSEQELMIYGHIMKLFTISCILVGLSGIGVMYIVHDKWKEIKRKRAEIRLQDEWMEENAAKYESSNLPW